MTIRNVIQSFESIGIRGDKASDVASAIKSFNWILLFTFFAAAIWSVLLYILDQKLAVIYPAIATFLIPCIFIFFWKTKNFAIPLYGFLAIMLFLPALVQIFHGGMINSGVVVAWGVVAPMTILAFKPMKQAKLVFFIYLIIIVLTVFIEFFVVIDYKQMPKAIVIFQFTLNLIGIISICFFPLLGFSQKLTITRKLLKNKNKEILRSIDYAKYIQTATLLPEKKFNGMLNNNAFLLFKPKDIVSGDFYWAYKTEDVVVLVCSDCTGHGVPGAFMTMMGINHLNSIVIEGKERNPTKILNILNEKVISSLENSRENLHDGMDITVCCIDYKKLEFAYSSAMSKIYHFDGTKVNKCPTSKASIGDSRRKIDFETFRLKIKRNDVIYLLTDGYIDQFGGDRDRKFGSKRLKTNLKEFCKLPIKDQGRKLNQSLIDWQGKTEQIDDVTFIGLKI